MSNIAKCVNIIKEKGADALILLDEANMHYLCSFSPSEGMIVIFSNGDAYHLVDSRYTETAQIHAEKTGLKVIEISQGFYSSLAQLLGEHNAQSAVIEN